jgi:ketosteroid isomerase-like protein
MSEDQTTADLALGWIGAWLRMDLDWLRTHLAEDFLHVSPLGRLEGREPYLAVVVPLARKSVADLRVRDVVATGDRAAVWFENHTPAGVVDSCDWVRIEGGRIREIRSFYDPAHVRETLSTEDQSHFEDME